MVKGTRIPINGVALFVLIIGFSLFLIPRKLFAEMPSTKADEIIASSAYDTGDYEKALATRMRIVSAIDQKTNPIKWSKEQRKVAFTLGKLTRFSDAMDLMEQVIAFDQSHRGPDDPVVADSLRVKGRLLQDQSKMAEAELLFGRALEIHEKTLGKEHPETAGDINDLAMLVKNQGRFDEAETLYRRALAIREINLADDPTKVSSVLNNLGVLLKAQNRFAEAEELYRRALQIDEKTLGKDHPDVAWDLNNLATLLGAKSKLSEAEPLFRRALEIYDSKLDKYHASTALVLNNLARLLESQGKLSDAESHTRRALQINETRWGDDSPQVAINLRNLASILNAQGTREEVHLKAQGKRNEAYALLLRALQIDEEKLGKDHPTVARDLNNLAAQKASRFFIPDETLQFSRRAVSIVLNHRKKYGVSLPDENMIIGNYANFLTFAGKSEDIEEEIRKLELEAGLEE